MKKKGLRRTMLVALVTALAQCATGVGVTQPIESLDLTPVAGTRLQYEVTRHNSGLEPTVETVEVAEVREDGSIRFEPGICDSPNGLWKVEGDKVLYCADSESPPKLAFLLRAGQTFVPEAELWCLAGSQYRVTAGLVVFDEQMLNCWIMNRIDGPFDHGLIQAVWCDGGIAPFSYLLDHIVWPREYDLRAIVPPAPRD